MYNTSVKRFHCKIHPSIHFLYPLNPSVGLRGGWSLSQRPLGERRGTPWTGRQSITGPHKEKRDKQPHTLLRTILETPINLKGMVFWTVGGEPMHTWGEHANSTQKGPSWELNLEPSRCEATVLNTTPPCSPHCKITVQYCQQRHQYFTAIYSASTVI